VVAEAARHGAVQSLIQVTLTVSIDAMPKD
jgi:hypothetical protein